VRAKTTSKKIFNSSSGTITGSRKSFLSIRTYRDHTNVADLTSKQEAAINLLATGSSMEEVAHVLGISRATISHWKRYSPVFRTKVEELKGEL
jgi:DNA-binding NarL/FixJ family response regulator